MTVEDNNSQIDSVIDATIGGPAADADTGGADGGDAGTTAAPADQTGQQPPKGGQVKPPASASGTGKPPVQQQRTQQTQTGNRGTTSDAQGNIVDAQGKVLVAAGPARRIYEQGLNAQRSLSQMQSRAERAESAVEAFQTANATFAQMEMGMDDVVLGAKILKAFRHDPQKTINFLLTQAQAQGHTVTVGQGQAPLTPEAIRDMMRKELAPFQHDRATAAEAERVEAEIETEYSTFVDENPEAVMHEDVIGDLMQRALQQGHTMTPDAAWIRVQRFALQNKLDLSKPLQPQMDARNGHTGGQRGPRAPLPNGRGGNAQPLNGQTTVAPANARTSDIVKESMRAAGIRI